MAMIARLAPPGNSLSSLANRSKQAIELISSYPGVRLQTVGSLIGGVSHSSCR
jgi:hypothetical protein